MKQICYGCVNAYKGCTRLEDIKEDEWCPDYRSKRYLMDSSRYYIKHPLKENKKGGDAKLMEEEDEEEEDEEEYEEEE